jgi:hypothetical protein
MVKVAVLVVPMASTIEELLPVSGERTRHNLRISVRQCYQFREGLQKTGNRLTLLAIQYFEAAITIGTSWI